MSNEVVLIRFSRADSIKDVVRRPGQSRGKEGTTEKLRSISNGMTRENDKTG